MWPLSEEVKMLEIFYDKATSGVKGWCGDDKQFGNFKPTSEEAMIILPVGIPPQSNFYTVDLVNKTVLPNPLYKPPIVRDIPKEVDAIKAKLGMT